MMRIALKRILMLTMHILLPNYTHFKTLGQFVKMVFVIVSTRANIRLIARAPFTGGMEPLSPPLHTTMTVLQVYRFTNTVCKIAQVSYFPHVMRML